jgi:hypothetical protein
MSVEILEKIYGHHHPDHLQPLSLLSATDRAPSKNKGKLFLWR